MENKNKLLNEILKHFNGMGKIEAYNITNQLESLLLHAASPIDIGNLESAKSTYIHGHHTNAQPINFTMLPNGNFCDFVDQNEWLYIYKENNVALPNWAIFETYYFRTKYHPQLQKLTRRNILRSIEGRSEELKVKAFLLKNSIKKKDVSNKKLLLLSI